MPTTDSQRLPLTFGTRVGRCTAPLFSLPWLQARTCLAGREINWTPVTDKAERQLGVCFGSDPAVRSFRSEGLLTALSEACDLLMDSRSLPRRRVFAVRPSDGEVCSIPFSNGSRAATRCERNGRRWGVYVLYVLIWHLMGSAGYRAARLKSRSAKLAARYGIGAVICSLPRASLRSGARFDLLFG